MSELGDRDDDEHDSRESRARGIDCPATPDLAALCLAQAFASIAQHPCPVHDHPGLAECERHEHADDVELDELGEICAINDQKEDGRAAEHEHPVRVDEAIAAGLEGLRRVGVAGQHRAEQWEAVERRVGREQQHQRRSPLDHVEHEVSAAGEGGRGNLRDHAGLGRGGAVLESLEIAGVLGVMHLAHQGEGHDADKQHDGDRAHENEGLLGVLDLRATEGGHAVGDRFDTGQGGASAGERPQQ